MNTKTAQEADTPDGAASELNAGLGFTPTHGLLAMNKENLDCAERSLQIFLDKRTGKYLIEFKTVWEEGTEPVITRIMLTSAAADLLQTAIFEFMNNRHEFEMPNAIGQGSAACGASPAPTGYTAGD